VSNDPAGSHAAASHAAFAALSAEIEGFVRGPGDEIEHTHAVPAQLWHDLRDRGFLRLAAPHEYGGSGITFSRFLELMELFSMSHASLRMIVHVCNGVWRAIGVSCDYWLLFARLAGTSGKDGTVAVMVDRHVPGVQVETMSDTMRMRGTDHVIRCFSPDR
jgi:alkylation response protein AidB-like acyl-CoA dehydrogenase